MKPFTFKATTHPSTPARIGTPVSSATMEALLDRPGPLEVTTVGADWEAPLGGLLNLKDPKAVQAGLTKRKEPIQIYAHVVRHPERGFFLIDTGVSRRFVQDPAGVGVGWVLRKFFGIEKMHARQSTAEIIEAEPAGQLEGVNDVFGDGSLFAIQTPGHTAGHLSFLARTTEGPVLMTGDTCHTRWGWENNVEPGTYLAERQGSRASLLALKALSERHPKMIVKLGHQA